MANEKKIFINDKIKPFLMKKNPIDLLSEDALYNQYCKLYSYDLDTREMRGTPAYKKMLQHLAKIKNREFHESASLKASNKVQKIDNQVLISKVKSVKVKIKTKQKEVEVKQKSSKAHKVKTIHQTEVKNEYKKIKKITFASPATKYGMEIVETYGGVANDMMKDYRYALEGGTEKTEEVFEEKFENGKKVVYKTTRTRHQFPHLLLRHKIQAKFQAIIKSPNSLPVLSKDAILTFRKQFELLTLIDNAPLEFMSKLAETGLNMQRKLQGAIFNDKAMVENNIVEIAKDVLSPDNDSIPKEVIDLFKDTESSEVGDLDVDSSNSELAIKP